MQDEAYPMKKTTQLAQALKSNIIRLSWPRGFLIYLRYMEVPEHSIPQMWMHPAKVMSSCDTWVLTVVLFFLDPSTFHYECREKLPNDISSRPEDLNFHSFIIGGASNRCDKNTPGLKHQVSIKSKFFPEWHVEARSLLPPVVILLCETVRDFSQDTIPR